MIKSLGRRRAAFIALWSASLLLVSLLSGVAKAQDPGRPSKPPSPDKQSDSSETLLDSRDGQSEPKSPVAQTKTEAVAPRLLQFVEAVYPPEALQAGLQAKVELEVTIGADGKVSDARVVTGAGHGFDEAALDAVRRFVFKPARLDGKPVPSRVRYPYIFEIREVPPPPAQPSAEPAAPPPANLQGSAYDRQEQEPLADAEVLLVSDDKAASLRTTSSETGKFEFNGLGPGRYTVRVVAKGYIDFQQKETLVSGQVTSVVYRLEPIGDQYAFGAVARVPPPPREVTRRTIESEQLTRIAGTRGDPLRAIEIMPGVARPPFSAGAIIVRGSQARDTRILFEGLQVENLYHFGGLTSFIHPRLVSRLDFFPGNFSVRYGRATGGIVETRASDPTLDGYHGVADINLVDASLLVQGPVTNYAGFALAARRSYIDFFLENALSRDTFNVTAAPMYWDYQAIGSARVSERDRLRLIVFGSSDRFKALFKQPEAGLDTVGSFDYRVQFHHVNATWSRRLSDSVDQDIDVQAGVFDTHASLGRNLYFDLHYLPINGRAEWRARLSPVVRLIGGLDLLSGPGKYIYRGPRIGQREGSDGGGGLSSDDNNADLSSTYTAFYPAVYLESDLDLKPVRIVLGTRVDYFSDIEQFSFDPRLVAFLALTGQLTLKTGVGLFSLPPQGYETTAGFGNPHLKPSRATHLTVGVDYQVVEGISVSLEGFYKSLFQRVVGTEYNRPPYFINDGIGRILGAELLVKAQPKGRFFGYIAYTLSRSERRDRDDEWRLFDHDQPHILTASGAYRPGRGWEFGATFRLSSGDLMTPVVGGTNDLSAGNYWPVYGRTNISRKKLFHRLDIRVEKLWKFKAWSLAVYLDLQNAYNRANQESLIYDYRYEKNTVLSGLPILPVIGIRGEL
jgi:TonB family protein